jgi:hypothetical protein
MPDVEESPRHFGAGPADAPGRAKCRVRAEVVYPRGLVVVILRSDVLLLEGACTAHDCLLLDRSTAGGTRP